MSEVQRKASPFHTGIWTNIPSNFLCHGPKLTTTTMSTSKSGGTHPRMAYEGVLLSNETEQAVTLPPRGGRKEEEKERNPGVQLV